MYISFNSEGDDGVADHRLSHPRRPARLQTVDGVANAQILGGQVFAMRIWLDPTRMAAHGVTANDVRAALAANNFTTAAGEVKSDFTQISVNALTSLDSPKAFSQLVVATHGDALVRLGDVRRRSSSDRRPRIRPRCSTASRPCSSASTARRKPIR